MQSPPEARQKPLLRVERLDRTFRTRALFGPRQETVAAREVSFDLDRGEAVALVGESGSGKSTIARLLLRLETADGGRVCLDGVDVLREEPRRASLAFRARVQMVFQDPFGSLNPVHDVKYHLIRPLKRHGRSNGTDAVTRAGELLATVGLEPPEEFLDRHPYELSGGQRQRVAIARALAVEPDLLVADEPTSMLDVSIRMDILKLLARLKSERGLGILLITHDLASARYLADRVLVLFRGRVVEAGPSREVTEHPAHPYTRALLESIAEAPVPGHPEPERASRPAPVGTARESGCPFASRCPEVSAACLASDPLPRVFNGRHVRCHLYEQGALAPGS